MDVIDEFVCYFPEAQFADYHWDRKRAARKNSSLDQTRVVPKNIRALNADRNIIILNNTRRTQHYFPSELARLRSKSEH